MTTIGIEEQAVRDLTDRAEITDAIYRYAAGLDHGDVALLESALTEDAVVDLSAATSKLGLDFPVLAPRDVVVGALASAVGPLDTSHSITNVRIDLAGDTATVRCYAQANHYLPGEGPQPDRTRHALMMNRYTAEMTRDGQRWRIRRLLIDCAWFDGDPQVLVALA
ncbi:MAG TPA: nuclear transport factor 2 family protein [Trebonia sp.]|nr:nuclear transport factor 2 family protein [Trebonia sp.]